MSDRVVRILKRPGCLLLSLLSGESLLVPGRLFRAHPLKVGDGIDLAAYRALLLPLMGRAALDQAARMLERRDHSQKEVADKLLSQGYPEEVVSGAVDRLCAAGFLDDQKYAAGLISRLGKKAGVRRLKAELARKGIPDVMAATLLEAIDPEEQLNHAVALAHKALRGKSGSPPQRRQRAYAALTRRGFPPDLVTQALERALAEAENE